MCASIQLLRGLIDLMRELIKLIRASTQLLTKINLEFSIDNLMIKEIYSIFVLNLALPILMDFRTYKSEFSTKYMYHVTVTNQSFNLISRDCRKAHNAKQEPIHKMYS